jgi:hypothetical protein
MNALYLDSLKALLALAYDAAEAIERTIPAEIRTQKWMAAKHSPNPWNVVHHKCMAQPEYNSEVLMTLSVRASLSICIEQIMGCIAQIEVEGKPLNLSLKKTKRLN